MSEYIYLSSVVERYPKFFFLNQSFHCSFQNIPADQLTSILLNTSAGVD